MTGKTYAFCGYVLAIVIAGIVFGLAPYCKNRDKAEAARQKVLEQYELLTETPEQKAERRQKKIVRWLKGTGCSDQNARAAVEFAEKLKAAGSPKSLEEVLNEKFCHIHLDHNCCDLESSSKRSFEFELEGCEAGNRAVVTFVYGCRHGTFKLSETWSWKQHEDPT